MTHDKLNITIWASLLTLAFIARLGVAYYWESNICANMPNAATSAEDGKVDASFFFGDSDSYWRLGRALAFGRPYEFDDVRHWQIFRTPGYPSVLAPLFWIFGEDPPIMAARIQGAILGTLNVALVALLANILFPFPSWKYKPLPILAGIFFAFDPTLVLQSVLVLSEESFLTFALLQNICLLDFAKKLGVLPFPSRDTRDLSVPKTYVEWKAPKDLKLRHVALSSLLLGLVTAATIYIRPSWSYYLPFAAIVLLSFRFLSGSAHEVDDYYYTQYATIFSKRKLVVAGLLTTAVVYTALTPWIVRNYRLTGQYVSTSLQMGASLYDGLNPSATGASDMSFVDRFREEELASPSASPDVHFEIRLDERMKRAAIDWVKTDPFKAIKLGAIKIYRLWAPAPREQAFAKPILKLALAVSFIPIFLLGLYGGIKSFKARGAAWFLLIPALYVTALHTIFVSSIRYRTPTLYGFSILAAYVLLVTYSKYVSHKRRSEVQKTISPKNEN